MNEIMRKLKQGEILNLRQYLKGLELTEETRVDVEKVIIKRKEEIKLIKAHLGIHSDLTEKIRMI